MQREVCQLIIKQQGHYLIVLKDNQPELRQTVQDWFEPFPPPDEYQMQHSQAISLGHGRIERRELWALHVYDDFLDWPGARLMLRLERTVIHKNMGLLRRELAYALSSLDLDSVGADKILITPP